MQSTASLPDPSRVAALGMEEGLLIQDNTTWHATLHALIYRYTYVHAHTHMYMYI